MEAEYLKETVGPVLVKALAEVVVAHPDDPIDFISQYLRKSYQNTVRNHRIDSEEHEIAKAKVILEKEKAEKLRKEEEERQEKLRLEKERKEKEEHEQQLKLQQEQELQQQQLLQQQQELQNQKAAAVEVNKGEEHILKSIPCRVGLDYATSVNLDCSILLLAGAEIKDVVDIQKLTTEDGSVSYSGDHVSKQGEDERIVLKLESIASDITTIFLFLARHEENEKLGDFGDLKVIIRQPGVATERYHLSGHEATAEDESLVLFKLSRSNEDWTLKSILKGAAARTAESLLPTLAEL